MDIDLIIIACYLIIVNIIGLKFSRAGDMKGYFIGGRSVHWVVACFSIVATETSTLTFISIPGLAYVSGTGFLQVAFGYLAGRVLVAFILIPEYFKGNLETAYQFIRNRFSVRSGKIISVIFHVTRILADSVRLFITAIPLTFMTGWDWWISIPVIGAATFIYTFYGGLRSIAVVDSVQFVLYILCGLAGIYLISDMLALTIPAAAGRIAPDSLIPVSSGLGSGVKGLFGSYNIFSGVLGGAVLSFASHGTDHLIVQRVLSCSSPRAAQKAMIMSGVMIIIQFLLFLLFGLFLKVLLAGVTFEKSDDIVPYFIVTYLPVGFRGLMLAGILAAAMSTLSSTINSLSSSTSIDILKLNEQDISDSAKVRISRGISLVWTLVIIMVSMLFIDVKNPLVEIGLSIASVTYGGMLGIFLLGRFFRNFSEKAALAGVMTSIVVNLFVAFGTQIFWLWYVVVGFSVSFAVAVVCNSIIAGRQNA